MAILLVLHIACFGILAIQTPFATGSFIEQENNQFQLLIHRLDQLELNDRAQKQQLELQRQQISFLLENDEQQKQEIAALRETISSVRDELDSGDSRDFADSASREEDEDVHEEYETNTALDDDVSKTSISVSDWNEGFIEQFSFAFEYMYT